MVKYDLEEDGVLYAIDGSSVTAVGYDMDGLDSDGGAAVKDNVTIDGTLYNVTAVRNAAFADCLTLTSVIIGNNVTSIGSQAFRG